MGLTVMGHRPRRQGLGRELSLFLNFSFCVIVSLDFHLIIFSLHDTRGRAGLIVLSTIGFGFGLAWVRALECLVRPGGSSHGLRGHRQ